MAALKQLVVASVLLIIQMVVFFLFAGQISVLRPWMYFGVAFFHYAICIVVQYKLNPELLVQRLKRKREGSKLWDEILMRGSNLMVILLIPTIAGLDKRYHWSNLDAYFAVLGLVTIVGSTVLLNWAMIMNPHFEPTVRIQKERDHKVITSGPYKLVRHPGYLAGILFVISVPLIIGSCFAFVPVGIYVILVVIRTFLEDNTLQEELEGYTKYASQVRKRLFPGIW
ncbi:MAG: isoprenylcysteine carboxylmethyltransferase family protein [Candidatus Bathyarchaeota archaeon]